MIGTSVADLVAGLLGGALVEHHLVGPVRLLALDDREPLEPVAGGRVGPVAAEAGGPKPLTTLPSVPIT